MKSKDKARPRPLPVERGAYMAVCAGAADRGERRRKKFKRYSNDVRLIEEPAGETMGAEGEERVFAAETVDLSLRLPGAEVLAACPKGG